MEVLFLKNDGRCKWLEKKVLRTLFPEMIDAAMNPLKKTMYLIEDWLSNEEGTSGADTKWLQHAGIPVIKNYRELPDGVDYTIINTAYDSIVEEEKKLLEKNIDYIDDPCPYIREIRRIFENIDDNYQYIFLCEPDHIVMKNFRSLYPKDMILIQMDNYKEKILSQQNGKPFILTPYVTFLPSQIKLILDFLNERFPERGNKVLKTTCLWISSPSSPIVEINNMDPKELVGVQDALLIIAPGSTNTSANSLLETLKNKGLNVVLITGLKEFIAYEKAHRDSKVLLVRSPIPNNAEKKIVTYIRNGLVATYYMTLRDFIKSSIKKYQIRFFYWIKRLRNADKYKVETVGK